MKEYITTVIAGSFVLYITLKATISLGLGIGLSIILLASALITGYLLGKIK